MSKLAIRIPVSMDEPMTAVFLEPTRDYEQILGAIFPNADSSSIYGMSTFMRKNAALIYDDNGLIPRGGDSVEEIVAKTFNPRAMLMYSRLSGVPVEQFTVPLVGVYLVIGLDSEGETDDVPYEIRGWCLHDTAENCPEFHDNGTCIHSDHTS